MWERKYRRESWRACRKEAQVAKGFVNRAEKVCHPIGHEEPLSVFYVRRKSLILENSSYKEGKLEE
jgi:hypothetical protein